jgi:hypothetical protein
LRAADGALRIAFMTSPHWPLAGLRLHTPRLELRWPTLADLDELVTLAAAGVRADLVVNPDSDPWAFAGSGRGGGLPRRIRRQAAPAGPG